MSTVATARPMQALRQRRESQRPNVAKVSTRINTMDSTAPKEEFKRYLYTQQDILAKFKGHPPSLRVWLHQNHFRLNDSQETLSYASPMRELLLHLREKTVPHSMLEELYALNVPFYDNCLIVEVHDLRPAGVKAKDDTATSTDDNGMKPFSIHNYHEYITPSPNVPYPNPKTPSKPNQTDSATKQDKDASKENMPAPGQPASQKQPSKPKVSTVVLFPSPQSHYTDIQILAATPASEAALNRRNQVAGRASGNPPTPLTAVPPTPGLSTGRSPKRQKMVIDDSNVHEFEAAILDAQCPKLYLEPTKNLMESVALIEKWTHPNNKQPSPERKSRKRTTAELAADEAEAADIQRYLLAGDEGQAGKTAAASGDDSQHAARSGANQQTFSRFKTLTTIRLNHEEAERRKKEEEARVAQAKRQAQLEAEAQKRRDEANRQAEQNAQNAAMLRNQQQQQQQQQNQQLAMQQQASQASQAQQMASQTPLSATQPQFSSPVVRQNTPMANAASPLVGAHVTHPMGGTPMVATSSNHGAGSPARPPSVMSQHNNAMARSASQQQNGLSRTGTPQMVQGTPVMNSAMPARNVSATPTPRMNHASPNGAMQGNTPIMMHTPQSNGMTPEQMQMAQATQQNQLQQQMRMRQQMTQNMSPGNTSLTLQQVAMQRAQLQIQTNGVPQGQNPNTYRQLLAQQIMRQHQQQLGGSPGMAQGGAMQGANGTNVAAMSLQQLHHQLRVRKQQVFSQYGQNVPPQAMASLRQIEMVIAQREAATQQQQQHMIQQQQQQGGQMNMNQGMQQQMNMQGANPNNPAQLQQYQQAMLAQRQQHQRQQHMIAMRQQMAQQQNQNNAGNGMAQGLMNNMQGMNMNMANMQGMNMANMQGGGGAGAGAMQGMQNMNMANMAGMQNMQNLTPSQQQQMRVHMMRQAQFSQMSQHQQQQQQQQQGQGQNGDGGFNFSGV
ncbi:unnamed protein product [Periconia digitata]|uniref:Spt20-like SEP domain-containing protein n=1 Tax=Periconia digitata TaxID=1303443 RepID=A0A9W4UJY8_9PLEO|nr:unnamed protein product [Periconia digitata]